jgi:hypothetical protein
MCATLQTSNGGKTENSKLGGFSTGNKGIFMGQLARTIKPFARDIRGHDE